MTTAAPRACAITPEQFRHYADALHQLALVKYNRLYDNRLFARAVNEHSTTDLNRLIDTAMALCGSPYHPVDLRFSYEAQIHERENDHALAFLVPFMELPETTIAGMNVDDIVDAMHAFLVVQNPTDEKPADKEMIRFWALRHDLVVTETVPALISAYLTDFPWLEQTFINSIHDSTEHPVAAHDVVYVQVPDTDEPTPFIFAWAPTIGEMEAQDGHTYVVVHLSSYDTPRPDFWHYDQERERDLWTALDKCDTFDWGNVGPEIPTSSAWMRLEHAECRVEQQRAEQDSKA